ncbi:MAG: hypothetical protein HPY71_15055 [Firmicutes bacterium]|nr:hypothetical protein [Bacillota bacterium]
MMAGLPKRSILFSTLLFIVVALTTNIVSAQTNDTATHLVQVVIPEAIKIFVEAGDLAFDFAREKEKSSYPPADYPAYYYPLAGEGRDGAVAIKIHSNVARQWFLYVKPAGDLTDGTNTIPISQLEWSTDRVTWTSFPGGGGEGFGVLLFSGNRLNGWAQFNVYYRLKLTGEEVGGTTYGTTFKYTLVTP